jgi:DNA-directed RNA polymerase specialized sigma24 family protein
VREHRNSASLANDLNDQVKDIFRTITITDEKNQLTFVIVLELGEQVDGTAQRSLSFRITRNLANHELRGDELERDDVDHHDRQREKNEVDGGGAALGCKDADELGLDLSERCLGHSERCFSDA